MRARMLCVMPLLAALLVACSGGGRVAGGGTGGTGMVAVRGQVASATPAATGVQTLAGAALGVQSIRINGISYDLHNADSQVSRSVERGMVVTVLADNGTTTRTAHSVFYTGDIKGPVTAVEPLSTNSAGVFTAMNHRVSWDEWTQTGPDLLTWLVPAACIEVSGFPMGDGRIHATYIAEVTPATDCGSEVEVVGFVTGTEPLILNEVLVVDVPISVGIRPDDRVHVKGQALGNATLAATDVIRLDSLRDLGTGLGLELDEAEVEGLVTGFIPPTDSFLVAGQRVRIFPSTKYSKGTTDNLADGVHVEVKGLLNQYGPGLYDIDATEVEFKDDIEVQGVVELVGGTLAFFGGQVQIQLNAATRDYGVQNGDCVELRARQLAGVVVATHVKREDDCDDEIELQGAAANVDFDNRTFEVLGMTIIAANIVEFDVHGRADSARFFAALAEGPRIVKLEGQPGPVWEKAEIED